MGANGVRQGTFPRPLTDAILIHRLTFTEPGNVYKSAKCVLTTQQLFSCHCPSSGSGSGSGSEWIRLVVWLLEIL